MGSFVSCLHALNTVFKRMNRHFRPQPVTLAIYIYPDYQFRFVLYFFVPLRNLQVSLSLSHTHSYSPFLFIYIYMHVRIHIDISLKFNAKVYNAENVTSDIFYILYIFRICFTFNTIIYFTIIAAVDQTFEFLYIYIFFL